MTTVLFWDIDGTLLTTGRAGIFAWNDAVHSVCGIEVDLSDLETAGLTDAEIAELLGARYSADGGRPPVSDLLRAYEDALPQALPRKNGRVLPMVRETLIDLERHPQVLSILLTGNTRRGAHAKLTYYGLSQFFRAGGAFCSGVTKRAEIACRARDLAQERLGVLDVERLYVVGDTPHDIACGRAIGARTIAVASGVVPLPQLEAEKPWLALKELPQPNRFREIIGVS